MRRYIRLEKIFIGQYLKRLMEYKIDFLLGAFGILLGQVFQLLFLGIIFSQIPTLKGWTFEQIVFIYGFSLLPKSIDHLFTDNLWMVGYHYVRKGLFDKYLTRPVNTLFQVIFEQFQIDAFGELFMSIVLLCYSIPRIELAFYWYTIPVAILVIIFATLIYTGLKTMTASISFWTKQSGHVTHMLYMLNDFSKYPVEIYNKAVRTAITYIIPFAFTAYFPALFFLTNENFLFNVGGTIIAGTLFMFLGILVWNVGLKTYESAGS